MNEYEEVERVIEERKLREQYCEELSNKILNINQHDFCDVFFGNNVNEEVEGHGWLDGSDFTVMEIFSYGRNEELGLVEIVARPCDYEFIGDEEITTEFQLSLVWYDRNYGNMYEFEIGTYDWHYGLYFDISQIFYHQDIEPAWKVSTNVLKFLSEVKY